MIIKNIKALIYSTIILFSHTVYSAGETSGKAPDFTLKSNSGKNIRLEELRGEVLFINFWASWCGPCKQEMPILDELHKRYAPAGFKVIGINVEQELDAAMSLLKKNPVSFPVLWDTDSEVSAAYNVEAMPTSILVDRNGNMRYIHRGYKPGYEELYREHIKELIKE